MNLRPMYLKHPRPMAVLIMLIIPFFLLRAVWREFSGDFFEAYRDLTKALITGKAE